MRYFVALVVLLVGSVNCIDENNGCMDGYIPFYSKFCITLTEPGPWLEATSKCPIPSKNSTIVTSTIEDQKNLTVELNNALIYLSRVNDIKEIWWFVKDLILTEGYLFDHLDVLFYPYFTSRWKWLDSKDSACITLDLKTMNSLSRSCTNISLPHYCIRDRYEKKILTESQSCPRGFVTGFGAEEYCFFIENIFRNVVTDRHTRVRTGIHTYSQLITQEQTTTEKCVAARRKRSNDKSFNSGHFHWDDVEEFCLSKGVGVQMLQRGYRNLIGHNFRLCGKDTVVPLMIRINNVTHDEEWIETNSTKHKVVGNTADMFGKRQVSDYSRVHAVNLTSGEWFFNNHYHFQCAICQTSRRLDLEPSLSLRYTADQGLLLSIFNFDNSLGDTVTCYNDASVQTIESPSYKHRRIIISEEKQENEFDITEERIPIEDIFFLRKKKNATPKLVVLNHNYETKLNYSLTRLGSGSKNLDISLLTNEDGNYWCMSKNRVTLLTIFTNRVTVEIPKNGRYLRYSVLVTTPLITLSAVQTITKSIALNFTLSLATLLKVTDGVLELKRITNNDTKLLFHVTLPPDHRPLGPNVDVTMMRSLFDDISICNTEKCPSMIFDGSRGETYDLPSTNRGESILRASSDPCVNVVFKCDGDLTDGAHWTDPVPTSRSCRLIDQAATQLHNLGLHPLNGKRLPEVTSLVKALFASGAEGSTPTTHVLHDIDNILTSLVLDENTGDVVQDVSSEVAILVSNLNANNPVIGISFHNDSGKATLVETRENTSGGTHLVGTQVAVGIPRSLVTRHTKLAFVVISSENAFHTSSSSQPNSIIVNVILSSNGHSTHKLYKGEFIDVMFKPKHATVGTEKKMCAFWDEIEKQWSGVGCELHHTTAEGMDVCRCNHLTHFAQIITGGRYNNKLSHGHETTLEVISITGCTLSLLGLLVIVVTAIVFKSWRLELGNKILLNLSAALTLNLITFLLVYGGVGGSEGAGCISVGAVLHYSVLACFCWMLIMSGLQVLRLLTILGNKGISNLLLKASIVGWGVPLIPVFILLAWDPKFYSSTSVESVERTFCYPSGSAFYVTIAAPVGFIVVVNIALYIVIACRLFSCFGWGTLSTDLQRHGITDSVIAMRRLRTLIFLFFLFGLTWTFGFLARYLFFTYLFCLTAPLQGFIIFVFFFVIEKKSRGYWTRIFIESYSKASSDTFTSTDKSSRTRTTWYSENVPLQAVKEDDVSNARKRSRPVSYALTTRPQNKLLESNRTCSGSHVSLQYQEELLMNTSNDFVIQKLDPVLKLEQNMFEDNLRGLEAPRFYEGRSLPEMQDELSDKEEIKEMEYENKLFEPQLPIDMIHQKQEPLITKSNNNTSSDEILNSSYSDQNHANILLDEQVHLVDQTKETKRTVSSPPNQHLNLSDVGLTDVQKSNDFLEREQKENNHLQNQYMPLNAQITNLPLSDTKSNRFPQIHDVSPQTKNEIANIEKDHFSPLICVEKNNTSIIESNRLPEIPDALEFREEIIKPKPEEFQDPRGEPAGSLKSTSFLFNDALSSQKQNEENKLPLENLSGTRPILSDSFNNDLSDNDNSDCHDSPSEDLNSVPETIIVKANTVSQVEHVPETAGIPGLRVEGERSVPQIDISETIGILEASISATNETQSDFKSHVSTERSQFLVKCPITRNQ